MSWYLEMEGASGTRVDLTPNAGSIKVPVAWDSVVRENRAGNRRVYTGPLKAASPQIPTLYFRTIEEVDRLMYMLSSGQVLTLGMHLGRTYRVKGVNGITSEVLDVPDAEVAVTIELVGV